MSICPDNQLIRVAPAIQAFIKSLSIYTDNGLINFYTRLFIHHLFHAEEREYDDLLNTLIGFVAIQWDKSTMDHLDRCWKHDCQSCSTWNWPLSTDYAHIERMKWKQYMLDMIGDDEKTDN